MSLYSRINSFLTDERFLTHVIALHVVFIGLLIVSYLLRRLMVHGGAQVVRWTGCNWLDGYSQHAVRKARSFIFLATLALMVLTAIAGMGYHWSGQDIRVDMKHLVRQITWAHVLHGGVALGELAGLAFGLSLGLKLIRRGRGYLESQVMHLLPHIRTHQPVGGEGSPQPGHTHEDTVKRWFLLLERFLMVTLMLTAIWAAGHVVNLGNMADHVVGFMIRMFAIFMVARLLVLACRTISHGLSSLGNKHLGNTQLQRYWERVTRLFPFGEKCFEAAVYISAASLGIRQLEFIRGVSDFGPRVVQCIGIFFMTRVFIELLQVLLNEAFGLYQEDRPLDQKGQTLVPLLQSISQYVLYFGSGVMMLSVLGIDTGPILAGAGILGLAGGLGAQSLVTDVVSGFFILFENQYLVGDIVQLGDASGRVEAVSIRHTQIRDESGKLYIIPNGQIKSVINFSKGFVNAVVDFKVPTTSSLDTVIHDMAEAGRRLRQSKKEVLGETVVKGLVDLGPNEMTVRTVTKVQPGSHVAMQNEFRRLLKQVLDERQSGATKAMAA